MNRPMVFVLSLISVVFFAALVGYGWVYRWGGPAEIEVSGFPSMVMPLMERNLELEPGGFDDTVWDSLDPLTLRMLHQVTTPPRGTNLVPEVDVRAFHNGRDIYFLLEWEDESESRTHNVGEFPDAVAVAFSLAGTVPSSSIMMGFESPVNMWQWKANLDAQFWANAVPEHVAPFGDHYTYEEKASFPVRTTAALSACQDLIADRPGSVTLKETTDVSGRGQWRAGKWRVIITRSLSTADQKRDVQLKPGPLYVAFAVWNGEKGDRGARKSISDWVVVDMKSEQGSRTARSTGNGFSLFSAAYAQETGPARPRVITIKAKRFEYQPSRITLQKGERVTIRLESLDVTHGLYLDGYGIQLKTNPTEVAKATFVADKTGRFTFRCSETCGEFHPYMVGFLMVEPNTRFRLFLAGTLGAGVVLAVVFAGVARKREATV